MTDSSPDTLRLGTHNGHTMVAALKRHRDKPVMFLGDTTLTVGEVADQMSRYIQAFEALDAGRGTPGALLALNRPEVLYILGGGQTQGYRRTSLHPLGSLDDHAYVLNDAEITTLIIDPVPMFVERALGLLEKVPGLTQVLTIGPVPEELAHVGKDLAATAETFAPQPLEAVLLPPDHIVSITYTGGTTGKPKGVIGTAQAMSTMTQVQLSEWSGRSPPLPDASPLSHAGAAFFAPTVIRAGRSTCCRIRPRRGAADDRGAEDHRDHAGAVDALRVDGPPRLEDARPVLAGDRLLRRVGDQPGAAGRGHRALRADLRAVLRAVRGPDGDQLPRQGRPRREAALLVRPAVGVPAHRVARRGRQAGARG